MLAEANAVADALNAAAGGATVTSGMLKAVESPAAWGFSNGQMPSLKAFFKLLDEKVINAMQARFGMRFGMLAMQRLQCLNCLNCFKTKSSLARKPTRRVFSRFISETAGFI